MGTILIVYVGSFLVIGFLIRGMAKRNTEGGQAR